MVLNDSLLLYPVTGFIGILGIAYYFYSLSRRTNINWPPSPKSSIPILGHLHHLLTDKPHIALQNLAKECGPLMHLRLGYVNVVVVSSEELAKLLMVQKGKTYASRPPTVMLDILSQNGSNLALARYGQHFRKMRKAAHGILMAKSVDKMGESIQFECIQLLKSFLDVADKNEPICPADYFSRFSLNIIFVKSFGRRFSDASSPDFLEFVRAVTAAFHLAPVGALADYLPLFRFLPSINVMSMRKEEKKVRNYLMKELSRIRQELELEKKLGKPLDDNRCFAKELLLKASDELSEKDVRYLMLDMIVAGMDTTAATMMWTVALLVNHPNVQERAFQEVDCLLNRCRLPNATDIDNLPYISAIVKEVLRFKPVGPFALPHYSIEDDIVNGYTIPKGTQVLLNIRAINDSIYQDQPDYKEFNPDRFIHETPSEFMNGLWTFGGGRRACVGMELAKRELFTATATLFYAFKFEPVDGKPISMEESYGLTVSPVPFKVKVSPRFSELKSLLETHS